MAQTETQVAALELERVLPKIETLFDYDDLFYASIKRRPAEKISNRLMRVPLELKSGGSFGYVNMNGGDLGRGGGPTYDKAVLNCVFPKLAIEYTKLTQYSTDDARKAIVNNVRRLTANAMMELRRQMDGQLMGSGNGVVGVISAVSTASGVDTYTLDSDGFGARLVRAGQTIQVFDSALTTLRGSGEIISVDVTTKQITVEPAIASSAATDRLVVQGVSTPSVSGEAIFGVAYHDSNASTGEWLGFDRATTPEIRSNRVNAMGSALTLPLPRRAINMIGNRVGINNDFNPTAWMHPAQKQAYEEIGQAVIFIQKQPKVESLNMYFDGMQMAGANVRVSFNWNLKRIDFVDDSVWGRAEILPIGFYKTDGRSIFEIRGASGGVASADIFYLVVGTQYFVNNPAATAYIDNLLVPTGY